MVRINFTNVWGHTDIAAIHEDDFVALALQFRHFTISGIEHVDPIDYDIHHNVKEGFNLLDDEIGGANDKYYQTLAELIDRLREIYKEVL